MPQHTPRQDERSDPNGEQKQVTQAGSRKIVSVGDSIGVTIPRKALEWTLEDTDIQGKEVDVTLYADGEYRISLPTESGK